MSCGSALDARSPTLHHAHHFGSSRHAGVAGGGHGQRAVGGTALYREPSTGPSDLRVQLLPGTPLIDHLVSDQEAVGQAGSERIAAADTIVDLEAILHGRCPKLVAVRANRAPVVDASRDRPSQRRRHDLKVGVARSEGVDHLPEIGGFELRVLLVDPFELEAEGGSKVFLITDDHVDVLGKLPVYLLSLRFSTDPHP